MRNTHACICNDEPSTVDRNAICNLQTVGYDRDSTACDEATCGNAQSIRDGEAPTTDGKTSAIYDEPIFCDGNTTCGDNKSTSLDCDTSIFDNQTFRSHSHAICNLEIALRDGNAAKKHIDAPRFDSETVVDSDAASSDGQAIRRNKQSSSGYSQTT